jgi:predicted metal-dependent hydrolase
MKMPVKVVHIQNLGNVTFSQNARSGTIRLRVKPDQTILVSFPPYVSFREALRFTEQHAEWVIRQKTKIEHRLPNFSEDEPIKTRSYTISFRKHPGKFSLKQTKNQIIIFYPEQNNLNDPEIMGKIQKVLTAVYRLEAKENLPPRLSQLAVAKGFQYGNITIRNNTSNWGSCSGRNNISLNLHLMKLPDHLIDYILLHELVHTRVKNHGPKFWELLNSVTNNQAKQLSKEVRKYSTHSFL